ncbi:MAG: serine/threonine protein kinase [Clostridium sp.]|nr:serine/threonine protein kinase [Clostridium sp.]
MIRCMHCMREYDEKHIDAGCPHCGYKLGQPPEEPYHLYPETVLNGRYIIGTVLGFGGFGITYKAWDYKLEMVVAIKEYYPAGIVNRVPGTSDVILYTGRGKDEYKKGLSRFLDETHNMAKFSEHENIVNVYDFFEENNTAYIVMEYLDGISFKEYINQQGGSVDTDTMLNVFLAVANALKELHRNKILHRDISPDNIFICEGTKIKLIDFGAARFSSEEDDTSKSIILKPGFAPPEQYRSKGKQGAWTDVYALGATMYRALTGVLPEESVNRTIEDTLKPANAINPDIPEHISNALSVAMALNEDLRFKTIEDFEDAITDKKRVLSVERELKRRKKRRKMIILAASLIVLLLGGIGIYRYKSMERDVKLNEATVVIWCISDGRDNELMNQTYEAMLAEFREDYPHITVNIEVKESYDAAIKEILEGKGKPTMLEFMGDVHNPEIELENISSVYDSVDMNNFYMLEEYQKLDYAKYIIPIGMDFPFAINTSELQLGAVNEELTTVVYPISKYKDIQTDFPGLYEVTTFALIEGKANYCWSDVSYAVLKNSEKDEILAAKRILYYFLNEKVQDIYYLQSIKISNGVPVNKAIFEEYLNVNGELSEVNSYISELKAAPDKNYIEDTYLNELQKQN